MRTSGHWSSLRELNSAALRYGWALHRAGALDVADRLYRFNRIPGTGDGSPTRIARALAGAELSDGWLVLRFRPSPSAFRYKLYVSPRPRDFEEALHVLLGTVPGSSALALKAGAGVGGSQRPDKLVVYFAAFPALAELHASLAPRLAGMAAQGVPFTVGLDSDGLCSWSADIARGGGQPKSWRRTLTRLLAGSFTEAGRPAAADECPWVPALERLRGHGIDTVEWSPGCADA